MREQTGFYCTTIKGEITPLSRDRVEAQKLFHQLKAKDDDTPSPVTPTFRLMADRYLEDVERTRKKETFRTRKLFLQSFCDHVGRKRVHELRAYMVTRWIAKNPTWGRSTRSTAISIVKACLNWAADQSYIESHPLMRVKRGGYKSRDRVLSDEERAAILGAATPQFRDFLLALEQTGARPYAELAKLTAAMVDFDDGKIVFAEHKNEEKGKRRTIFMTPALMEILKRLAEKRPEGLLFRNLRGNAWNAFNAKHACESIIEKTKVPHFTPYAFRHSLITHGLEKGIPVEVMAELVGNTPGTIHQYYSHVTRKDMLKEAAKKAASD